MIARKINTPETKDEARKNRGPPGLRAYGKVKLISLRSVIFDYIVVLIIY